MALGLVAGTRLLTEFLSPAVFGTVSLLTGVLSLARTVFGVSILQAALRYYGELAPEGGMTRLRHAVSRLLVRTMVWPVLAILAAGVVLAVRTQSSPLSIALLAVLLAALLGTDVARSYESNFLVAARRQREASILDALEALGRPALAIGAILVFGPSALSVLGAYLTATGLALVAVHLGVEREGNGARPTGTSSDTALGRELLRYALPLMPMAAVIWISGLSDRYIIGAVVGRESVGIYAAAYGLVSQPFLMAQALLDRTLTPPYFLAVSRGDRAKEHETFRVLLVGTLAVCGAGVLGVWIFSDQIASVFLASTYRTSAMLMGPIATGNCLLAIQYVFAKHLYAHKRTGEIFAIYTIGALVSLAVTVPMVFAFGVWGAALACPVYYLIQLLVTIARTHGTVRRGMDP